MNNSPTPDAVFGPTPPMPALTQHNEPEVLSEQVAKLSASLGVPLTANDRPYDPDAFIAAIQRHHQTLLDVKEHLSKRNDEQRAKAVELDTREKAVKFREDRMAAYERLSPPVLSLARLWPLWRHR